MKKIIDFLQELGLTEMEAILYQGLLEIGSTTVMELAKHTGIKRITVHFNIENLIQKGIVAETIQGARRQIVAEPPQRLEYLIEQKHDQVKNLKVKFPEFLNTIGSIYLKAKNTTEVEIKYYEGVKTVLAIYNDALKYNEMYSFADLDRYYESFPNTRHLWDKAYVNNPKREVWDIVIDSPLARSIKKTTVKRYHVKFIQRGRFLRNFKFSDYLVFGNTLAIIELDPGHVTATVIESKDVALTFKAIHHAMWELLPD